jgi:hypothetical protein
MHRPAEAARPGPSLQVAAGIAAVLEALSIIAFAVLIVVVQPAMGFKDSYWDEPAKAVPFVVAHQSYFFLASLLLIASALIVPPIVLALYGRLRALSPGMIIAATCFGAIGAAMLLLNALAQYAEFHELSSLPTTVAEQAEPYANIAYAATNGAAQLGLGLWIFLLSWAVVSRGGLPRWLGYFGLLVGITSPLALFGPPIGQLLSIVWFIAVGITLVRAPAAVTRSESQVGLIDFDN